MAQLSRRLTETSSSGGRSFVLYADYYFFCTRSQFPGERANSDPSDVVVVVVYAAFNPLDRDGGAAGKGCRRRRRKSRSAQIRRAAETPERTRAARAAAPEPVCSLSSASALSLSSLALASWLAGVLAGWRAPFSDQGGSCLLSYQKSLINFAP